VHLGECSLVSGTSGEEWGMNDLIDIAVIEDNRMFIDGLRAWAETEPDIRLAAVTSSVDELLGAVIPCWSSTGRPT
jgi:hypothetical protein